MGEPKNKTAVFPVFTWDFQSIWFAKLKSKCQLMDQPKCMKKDFKNCTNWAQFISRLTYYNPIVIRIKIGNGVSTDTMYWYQGNICKVSSNCEGCCGQLRLPKAILTSHALVCS